MINGSITQKKNIVGSINLPTVITNDDIGEVYDGEHTVIPKAKVAQILNTKNKKLTEDILILEIPFFETSNESNGTTIYIGNEV